MAPPADDWLAGPYSYPTELKALPIVSNPAPALHAEIIAGHLKAYLAAEAGATNQSVVIVASQDSPGHWTARDWREFPMQLRGGNWETILPVDDLYVPLAYFSRTSAGPAGTAPGSLSPMRVAVPGRLGMEIPSHPFYPYIEGFEEGLHRWELVGRVSDGAEMKIVPMPHDGKSALEVRIPARQTSATVATTRVRGRQLADHHATGLRLWLRTSTGSGRAGFTLFANAHGPEQVSATCNLPEPAIDTTWRKVELPLSAFPGLTVSEIDWFAIEFIGAPGTGFLIDDLSFMGPWALPGD